PDTIRSLRSNIFDPLNIDSDNDVWHDAVGNADEGVKMMDKDEDYVVESPTYHNDFSYNMFNFMRSMVDEYMMKM
ncbi:hypothetical protein EJD97_007634, partial [Solanum chilense]